VVVLQRVDAMPVIEPPDPDLKDPVRRSVRLPDEWWARLDEIEEETDVERVPLVIQLVRASLNLPEPAPIIAEGREFLAMTQSSVGLTKGRWAQIDAEAERRAVSGNRMFQAHLWRGIQLHERDPERPQSKRKPKR
jgi:hypothetical protein